MSAPVPGGSYAFEGSSSADSDSMFTGGATGDFYAPQSTLGGSIASNLTLILVAGAVIYYFARGRK